MTTNEEIAPADSINNEVYDRIIRVQITEYDKPLPQYPLQRYDGKITNRFSAIVRSLHILAEVGATIHPQLFLDTFGIVRHLERNRSSYGITAPTFTVRVL